MQGNKNPVTHVVGIRCTGRVAERAPKHGVSNVRVPVPGSRFVDESCVGKCRVQRSGPCGKRSARVSVDVVRLSCKPRSVSGELKEGYWLRKQIPAAKPCCRRQIAVYRISQSNR